MRVSFHLVLGLAILSGCSSAASTPPSSESTTPPVAQTTSGNGGGDTEPGLHCNGPWLRSGQGMVCRNAEGSWTSMSCQGCRSTADGCAHEGSMQAVSGGPEGSTPPAPHEVAAGPCEADCCRLDSLSPAPADAPAAL